MRRLAALVGGLVLLASGLAGCGGDDEEATLVSAPSTEDTSAPVPARSPLSLVVKDPAGVAVLTVDLAADGSGRVQGNLGGVVDLSAGRLSGGRRSWASGSQPLGEARLEDSGKLKLKGPNGATLWVAKPSSAEKTKLLEGEDTEVYSLQTRPTPGEAKVKQGEEEVGAVKARSSGGAKVERPDGTTVFETDLAAAPGLGLLVMSRIPAPQRALLLVELVDRSRP